MMIESHRCKSKCKYYRIVLLRAIGKREPIVEQLQYLELHKIDLLEYHMSVLHVCKKHERSL